MRIRFSLLSMTVRTMRHTSPYQVSGSGSLGSLSSRLPPPGPGEPGALLTKKSSWATWSAQPPRSQPLPAAGRWR
jgi:hypothetical protein